MRLRSWLCASLAAFLFLAVTIVQRVPQERQTAELFQGHAIFKALQSPNQKIQVVGTVTFGSGGTYQDDGVTPHRQ
ncbi:MAG: hypothetical protein DMG57_15615 [Acidobacteria bacterium]|nr:MAG: hypothetical protein DMG57_15615 [Acidobacteriota bacterium]